MQAFTSNFYKYSVMTIHSVCNNYNAVNCLANNPFTIVLMGKTLPLSIKKELLIAKNALNAGLNSKTPIGEKANQTYNRKSSPFLNS